MVRHTSGSASDTDGGWSEVVLATPTQVDLLTLTNGLLQELGQTALPTGKYTQLRLVLAANGEKLSKQNGARPVDTRDPLRALNAAARVLGLQEHTGMPAQALAAWQAKWQSPS